MIFTPKARPTLICIVSYALTVGVILAGCSQPESKDKVETADMPSASSEDAEPKSTLEAAELDPITEVASSVRSADSHIHGGAVLSIVSENNAIQIEFETPLYNLLGFEYAPTNDAEDALVSNVEVSLIQPQNLFRFNDNAKCVFDSPTSKFTLFDTGSDADHDGHDQEDDHDHSDHHETDAEAEDHDLDEHHQHEDGDSHKDVFLTYSMTCLAIEKLKTVEVELFDIFPNLTELELVYLGPSQQMSSDLIPSNATADLTR